MTDSIKQVPNFFVTVLSSFLREECSAMFGLGRLIILKISIKSTLILCVENN